MEFDKFFIPFCQFSQNMQYWSMSSINLVTGYIFTSNCDLYKVMDYKHHLQRNASLKYVYY